MITYTLRASDLYRIIDEAIRVGSQYSELRKMGGREAHEYLEKARQCCLVNAQALLLERGEKEDTGPIEIW